jgi:hypothetical protein
MYIDVTSQIHSENVFTFHLAEPVLLTNNVIFAVSPTCQKKKTKVAECGRRMVIHRMLIADQ